MAVLSLPANPQQASPSRRSGGTSLLRGRVLPLARRDGAVPLAVLLCTLATVFLFAPDRSLFLGKDHHNHHSRLTHAESLTYEHLVNSINMWPRHYFVSTNSVDVDADGKIVPGYMYNRFPVGGRLLLYLAMRPFDDPWNKVRVARTLMIVFFLAAATLAYFALAALAVDRWAAVAATLLAFGSSYHFAYHDMTHTQGVVGLFGVMLVFHGMAALAGRLPMRGASSLRQLLAKTCVAALLDWRVFALLLPFVALGIVLGVVQRDRSRVFRHVALGATALTVGSCVLAFNLVGEFLALGGQTPWGELPSLRSALSRASVRPLQGETPLSPTHLPAIAGWTLDALWTQFARVGEAMLPHALTNALSAWLDNEASPYLRWIGMAATLAAIGLGATARRGRVALISVVLAGWCWALPMRNHTQSSGSEFEALFFVGVPLVVFALVLTRLGQRERPRLKAPLWPAAALAAVCFMGSAVAMARERHAIVDFEREAAVRQDIGAIRELAPAGAVLHAPLSNAPNYWKYRATILLAGRPILPSAELVVAFALPDARSLTPENRLLFLFRQADYQAAAADVVVRYRWATEQLRPVVTSGCCDVYLLGDEVLYHDRDCRVLRAAPGQGSRFFLHATPVDIRDLPVERKAAGFGNYNFGRSRFQRRDGFCFAALRLPSYDIAEVHTGQFETIWLSDVTAEYRELWGGRFSLNPIPKQGR